MLDRLKVLITGGQPVDLVAPQATPATETINAAQAFRQSHQGQSRLLIRSKAFEGLGPRRIRDALLQSLDEAALYLKPSTYPRPKTLQVTLVKKVGRERFYVFAEGLVGYELPAPTASAS